MKNSSKMTASVVLAAVLVGGGAASAFAAEPTPAQTAAVNAQTATAPAFPNAPSFKIEGASMGGTYHTKETGSQKIVSLWGDLNTTNNSSSFTIKLAGGQTITMPATKAFAVNGSTGVFKTSYAYGTDYSHSISFDNVRNVGPYSYANINEPGLHLRNVKLEAQNPAQQGNYEFVQDTQGTYNGQDATISYGNLDFATNRGQLFLDDAAGGSIASFQFSELTHNGTTIVATTATGQTITLTASGTPGHTSYTMTGAGTNFTHVELIQD
jgi:hypothetical protein